LHYANLTEYWRRNKDFGKDATTGFILQTGLAPGYIDLLQTDFSTILYRF
jgi:hypothetical protein